MSAKIIVVEGPDKSGKATQAYLLTNKLKSRGLKVRQFEIPYDDYFTHKIIYFMLRNGWAKKYPNAFQVFQFLNKFIFQSIVLFYYKMIYDYVIFDRWSLSMIVYGDATDTSPKLSRFFYELLLKPDITLIMRGKSYKRDTIDDSYEKDSMIQKQVNIGYKSWFMQHHDVIMINNSESVSEVHNYVINVIDNTFFTNKENT